MKVLKSLTLLTFLGLLLAGCADTFSTSQSEGPSAFVGDWVISNWEERGTVTHKYDGRLVTISQSSSTGLFSVESTDRMALPDSFFEDPRYSLEGRSLIGTTIPDYEELKSLFQTTPDNVLQQAAASKKVVYRMSLELVGDGRIQASRNNISILYEEKSGRYSHVQKLPNWKRFTLTRR